MTGIDIIILVVLVLGLVRGAFTGAIKQTAQLGGLVLAFYLAYKLMLPAGAMAGRMRGGGDMGAVIGFILVFIGVQVLVFLGTRAAEGLLGVLRLSFLNRALGGLLGIVRATLILSVIFVALRFVGIPDAKTQEESLLYRPVASVVPTIWRAIVGPADARPPSE